MIGDVARSEAPQRFISGVAHFLVLKDTSGNRVFAFVSEKKNILCKYNVGRVVGKI